jgi:hypothetical protein
MNQPRIRGAAGVTTAAPAIDDLSVLLPDWRTHLRARNVAPSTIASYLAVGGNLLAWLQQAGMPTSASGISREHLEAFLDHQQFEYALANMDHAEDPVGSRLSEFRASRQPATKS